MMMTKKWHKVLFATLLMAVAALVYQVWFTAPASAAGNVAQIWHNVQRSDSYTFTASVENKSIPLATIGNIGRFSKTTSLYLEGQNDLRDDELQLAIWGGGVNVLDQGSAYQMRVSEDRVETRVGDGAWQTGSDLNVGMAPGGDFLAFLDVATDVVITDNRANPDYTIYQFNVDGHAYAQRLSQISQEYLVRTGQLPNGVALQVPDNMKAITGSGELWVDVNGLPAREIVTLNIPAAEGADFRTEATLDVQFSQYEGTTLISLWQQPGRLVARVLSSLPTASQTGFGLTALFAVLGFMAVIIRPNRKTQRVIISVLVAIILATPLMQVRAADVASDQIATFQAKQEESAASDALPALVNQPVQQPYVPPAEVQQPSDGTDSDGDGLSDGTEALLGTNSLREDSDFDGITDLDEITGFNMGGQTWYGQPSVADSNGDSVLDGQEWNVDTDNDTTPDLYDFDDDGDSVPDKVDISRLVASKADNGTAITFTAANPLQLTLTGLTPDTYTFVDLQIRPTNPDHLWYAFNVHNWPKDEKGNMQDWDNATFFDDCVKNGGTNCSMSTEDNGDIKFIPMLEVALPDLSNLPHTGNGQLDKTLLDKYGISIQPAGDGSYYAYVPLNLVEDPETGAKVAFQAKFVYQAAASWTPQQARLVWSVAVLNENYEDADAAAKIIRQGGGIGQNHATILHAYNDDFYLTGLNVHESHSVEMAIVYEDPAVDTSLDDDDGLMQMTTGLDNSLFVNRDCDFVNNDGECVGNGQRDITISEIYRRWNHPTNTGITEAQRWGIPDQLRVETYTFPSEDHALFQAGGQIAPNILTTHFNGSGVQVPNLLFVRENRFRALNADIRNLAQSVTWSGQSVQVNFNGETETVTVGYNMAPYRYNTTQAAWEAFPIDEYADHVRASFASTNAGLPPEGDTPEVIQASAMVGTINIVMVNKGQSAVISTNSNNSTGQSFLTVSTLFEGVNLSDEALRADYLAAINTTADRIIQYVRYASESLFTIDDYTHLFRSHIKFGTDTETFMENALKTQKAIQNQKAFLLFNAVLVLGGIASIIAMHTNKAGKIAGEAIALSVNAAGAIIDAATTISQINAIVIKANPNANSLVLKAKTLAGAYSINHVTTKIAAVGMVIGIALTWIVFFAAWGTSGLAVGSIAFNTLLAASIASTLVIVVTFFVSLTVVGAIVLAIFAVFDLLTFIICKAGAKGACDLGITAAITQALTDWIYQGEVMIDLSGKPPISNIDDMRMKLTNPTMGLVVGNGVSFQADMFTLIRHNWPKPSVVYHYDDFYTSADLQSSSVVYSLDTSKIKLNTERGNTVWWDAWPYDIAEALVPSPGIGWLVPTEQSKVLWQAARFDTIVSPVYDFTTPQINREFPLWINTGMALPSYDCWFSVCSHKTVKSPSNTDLTGKFVLDILPNTLDGFYTWNALGLQNDLDGDGIPRTQDFNDALWDTDGDGVPDKVEIEYGSSRNLADKDGDGLNDALEMRYSTNPNAADTDGDSLSDAVEVNGYLITVDGHTFRITTDPLKRDGDFDGMSDGAELRLNQLDSALYPFHPGVFNDSPVRLYTDLSDEDRVLAISASTTITTTVFNGLKADSLLATGEFTS
ncbi:MAG TPA: hypothetical protein PK530_05020, partial [Anaerolineales bacterium]|nr:hypothetical protein [Anaerolineales bacterium]